MKSPMKPVHPQDIWKRQLWQLQILQIRPGEPPYFQMEKKNEPQKRPEIDDNNWCAMTLTHILNSYLYNLIWLKMMI